MEQIILLLLLGFMVGTFGTIIGSGGGFILVPVLLLLYPDKSPETITSMSLVIVFFNAVSGSFAYAKMKRIDYKSSIIFALSAIPGSIMGAKTTLLINREIFNGIYGIILIAISILLIFKQNNKKVSEGKITKNCLNLSLTDAEGLTYLYSYNPVVGIIISIFIGYISSLLGIGGGIIHVPVLVHILSFPIHIATATSQFVLAVMSLTGSIVHIASGILLNGMIQTISLSIGVLFGAQLGARLSNRFNGGWIIKSLAIVLGLIGVRSIIMEFYMIL